MPSQRAPSLPPTPRLTRPHRRTRGDGNCFFRSFLFGYLEHLLLCGDVAERDRLLGRLAALKKELVEVGGYDDIGERRLEGGWLWQRMVCGG